MKRKLFVQAAMLACLLAAGNAAETAGIGDDFVLVEGGTFWMGAEGEAKDELPVHRVTVDSFYMCVHEVTQAEYQKLMIDNPSYFKGEQCPVECVSWYDAVEYCIKRSVAEGLVPCYNGSREVGYSCDFSADGYRLPTEAEWEYAAGGGSRSSSKAYSGSDFPDNVAWYSKNSIGKTHDVMTKAPNELGLYDMSGNVWEWCWDRYAGYSDQEELNPVGPSTGFRRVLRGGSWDYGGNLCRVANRGRYLPDGFGVCLNLGFRLVRSARPVD